MYPALETLFGAYLNEDVFDHYPDVAAAVQGFTDDHEDLASQVPAEIEALLASTSDDSDLSEATLRLGLGIDGGMADHREWLTQIADRVRAATS